MVHGWAADSRNANPPYGSIGELLPVVANARPNLVSWGPTAVTKAQYLYSSKDDIVALEVAGIYLNTVGNASGGTQLVPISAYYDAELVVDIEWLPDASGLLFTKRYVDIFTCAQIFEYNFATKGITQLTSLTTAAPVGSASRPTASISYSSWWRTYSVRREACGL